MTDMGIVVQAV